MDWGWGPALDLQAAVDGEKERMQATQEATEDGVVADVVQRLVADAVKAWTAGNSNEEQQEDEGNVSERGEFEEFGTLRPVWKQLG